MAPMRRRPDSGAASASTSRMVSRERRASAMYSSVSRVLPATSSSVNWRSTRAGVPTTMLRGELQRPMLGHGVYVFALPKGATE